MALQLLSPIHKASRQISLYLETLNDEFGVSPREGHLICYLKSYEPCELAELLRVFGHKPSTLTSMLDRLSLRKLITRDNNPTDRRSFIITLTPNGKKIATAINKQLNKFEQQVLAKLTEQELAGFQAVMAAIARVTEVQVTPTRK